MLAAKASSSQVSPETKSVCPTQVEEARSPCLPQARRKRDSEAAAADRASVAATALEADCKAKDRVQAKKAQVADPIQTLAAESRRIQAREAQAAAPAAPPPGQE